MEINKKAHHILSEMFGNVDFSVAGYRPSLNEPLIFALLSDKTMRILEKMGYRMTNNALLASTQKQLIHGMRMKKLDAGRALSKEDFLNFPKKISPNNLYVGINARAEKELRFFWDIEAQKAKYVYFKLNGELGTYGITNIEMVKISIKVEC